MVGDLQAMVEEKEEEKKRALAQEQESIAAMRKRMTDYIKKHAQVNMEKASNIIKLEKEIETLKKVGREVEPNVISATITARFSLFTRIRRC